MKPNKGFKQQKHIYLPLEVFQPCSLFKAGSASLSPVAVSEARANLYELNILVRQNRALIRQDPSYEVRSQVWSVPHTKQCLSGAARL